MKNKNIRLGLCCLVLGENKSNFKTLQLGRTLLEQNQEQKIFSVWNHNQRELVRVINYCETNNIWHYRISSDMFPLADHPAFNSFWLNYCHNPNNWVMAKNRIYKYLQNGGRVSTHPSQFCIISSSNPDTNEKGILNLEYHGKFFDLLGIPQSYFCPINIHISNGKLENIAAENTINSFNKLSDSVKSRLVFETEDKNYWTFQRIKQAFPNTPITLDFHHRLINNLGEGEEEAYRVCVETWGDIKPLFHYSEGRTNRLDRAHSDYVNSIPELCENIDLEIEAKQKNLAILKLMNDKISFNF